MPMARDPWNERLNLPDATLQGNAIPTAVLIRQGRLTKKEQKTLAHMEALSLIATMTKANTGILPVMDGTHDIQAVLYFDCAIRDWSHADAVAAIVHKVFPNPTVVLMRADDTTGYGLTGGLDGGFKISVGLKRNSLVEHGATVVESVETTGLLDPWDDGAEELLDALAYERLPQRDLLDLVHGMQDAVLYANVSGRLGFFPRSNPVRREAVRGALVQLKELDREIARLRAKRRDRDTAIGESSRLRVVESGKTEETRAIVERIKELCHD